MPHAFHPRYSALLLCIFSCSAFTAQAAPLSPHIDEDFGCKPFDSNVPAGLAGKNSEALAKENCKDYQASPLFAQAPKIQEARAKCEGYFTQAHKLMNSFCSYQADMNALAKKANVIAGSEGIGKAKDAEAGEAEILADLMAINQAYQKKVSILGQKFHDLYPQYLSSIGQMNGEGATNEANEAFYCKTGALDSAIPGLTQQALASVSHANASLTYESMFNKATRQNMKIYRSLADMAGAKEYLANIRAHGMGEAPTGSIEDGKQLRSSSFTSFGKEVPEHVEKVEIFVRPVVQQTVKVVVEKYLPNAVPLPSIVGGGVVIAYSWYKNKRIMVPESTAAIIGMIHPWAGVAASFIVSGYRANQASTEARMRYQAFVSDKIKSNFEQNSFDLVEEYAQKNKDPACVSGLRAKRKCLATHPAQAYDHSCGR